MCSTGEKTKKCSNCGEFKPLEAFAKNNQSKDGRAYRCKECVTAAAREKKFNCTCKKEDCKESFKSNDPRAKFCPRCKPRSRTPEQVELGVKWCFGCRNIKKESCFFKLNRKRDGLNPICKTCSEKARKSRRVDLVCANGECKKPFTGQRKSIKFCPDCRPQPRTKEECHLEALKYSRPIDFHKGSSSTYQYAQEQGWLDEIQSHMIKSRITRTDGELKTEMRKWSGRYDFSTNNNKYYVQAIKKSWYKEFSQELWGEPRTVKVATGCSRSDFIKNCERKFKEEKTNGLGLLYLIKCWKGEETFYKIGITSLGSVKARYRGNDGSKPNSKLNYYYEILWTEEGPPGLVWDLESSIKSATKEVRHQPEFWKTNSLETFKCHGNNKILRRPSLLFLDEDPIN